LGATTIDHAAASARGAVSARSDADILVAAGWRHGGPGATAALFEWVEHSGEPVVAVDRIGHIAIANPAFARAFAVGIAPSKPASGRAPVATPGCVSPLARFVPLLSPPRLARWIDERGAMPTRVHRLLAEAIGADGDRFLVAATLLPLSAGSGDGEPCCVVALRPLDAQRGLPLIERRIAGEQPVRDSVTLGALLDAVARAPSQPAARRRIHRAPHDVAACIEADPDAVRDVLARLIDNALRHTPAESPVTLRSRRDSCEPAGAPPGAPSVGHIVITVADRGPGFTRSQLQRAFEPFARTPSGESGTGPGLGLAIARHLVEAQHGWIELRSVAGVGTEAEVWLPEAH
jgi:signal transduction histidine kinase